MSIAQSVAGSVASSVASSVAGSGGGVVPVTPWQSLLNDPALIMRFNGDANVDGTGDANDWTGSYNGTWVGTPTYGTAPSQTDGKAIDTASGRAVEMSYVAMTGLAAWTVCGWVKPRTLASNNSPWIGHLSTNSQPCIRMSGNKWNAYAFDNANATIIFGLTTNVNVVLADRWDHIALTYDGTNAKIYWNGADVSSGGTIVAGKTLGNNNGSANARIGGGVNASTSAFDGLTADTRAYSRALTIDELAAIVAGDI